MVSIRSVIMAIALLFGSVLPVQAEVPTKTAIVEYITSQTNRTGVTRSEAVRIVNASFAEANKHGIDPFLIVSLINTESKFRWWAKNGSGARGLTQVIPRWHREKIKGRNLMHIETNIEVGTRVLVECLKRNKGYIKKALRCYSGGARNYSAKLKAGYRELRQADIIYRFKNDLPLVVVSKFEEPTKFTIISNHSVPTLAKVLNVREGEPQLLAENNQ